MQCKNSDKPTHRSSFIIPAGKAKHVCVCVCVCVCSTLKLTDIRSGFQQALTTGPARQTEPSFSLHPPAWTETYRFGTLPVKKEQQKKRTKGNTYEIHTGY